MSQDLSSFLASWPYDPEDTTRIVEAADGRRVMQVRLPLGIEQYELDGRPDGTRPFGRETVLDEIEHRLGEFVAHFGSDGEFVLEKDSTALLQSEGVLFYYRYLLLFQLNDFRRVRRDTEHNLRICDLLERYAQADEDKKMVLQYKPYILRMNAMSRAMIAVEQHMKDTAVGILQESIEAIEAMEDVDTPAFQFEKIRSLNYLRSAIEQVAEHPTAEQDAPPPRLKLERELEEAVEEEDYERAALLRDRIRGLA